MAWSTVKRELGICVACAKCKDDCVGSNIGWICHDCWQAIVRGETKLKPGTQVTIRPPSEMSGFVVIEDSGIFLTVGGTLYFFQNRDAAEDLLKKMLKAEPGLKAKVVETQAIPPFLYICSRPELRMLFVEALEGKETQ